jgi:hypothetical protein
LGIPTSWLFTTKASRKVLWLQLPIEFSTETCSFKELSCTLFRILGHPPPLTTWHNELVLIPAVFQHSYDRFQLLGIRLLNYFWSSKAKLYGGPAITTCDNIFPMVCDLATALQRVYEVSGFYPVCIILPSMLIQVWISAIEGRHPITLERLKSVSCSSGPWQSISPPRHIFTLKSSASISLAYSSSLLFKEYTATRTSPTCYTRGLGLTHVAAYLYA